MCRQHAITTSNVQHNRSLQGTEISENSFEMENNWVISDQEDNFVICTNVQESKNGDGKQR